ncbi:hypothetical protein PTKIN_Ptkin11bG0104300 [Pterospermum kingtungense]
MDDSGNFMLLGSNSILWESFKNPADTLLPKQNLDKGVSLSSRQSETNFSMGRFRMVMQSDGNLVLTSINLPSDHLNEPYYESDTTGDSNSSSPGYQLVFNESGYLFVLRENDDRYLLTQRITGSAKDVYYRATLVFDGVFTLYSHPKASTGDARWTTVWSEPDNICTAALVSTSSGVCGFNSICNLNAERRPICDCPKGYTLVDPNDHYGSCKPNFTQSCEQESAPVEDLYGFEVLTSVDWPLADYALLEPFTEDQCRKSCLYDCMCAVAIFRLGDKCWKKKLPLSNGRFDPSLNGGKALLKVRKGKGNPPQPFGPYFPNQGMIKKNRETSTLNRLLVYEYLSNGTLANFLFGDSRPSWSQRTQIAFGIARGLLYLHEECSTQIIHCDIKPQNILLDEHYNAKISDFGLAKLLLLNQSHTNTAIRGTKGYVAPEWFRNLPITVKVDVYSFGVLLLELTCCRRSVDVENSVEERAILTDWAYDCYCEGRLDALVEHDTDALNDRGRVERFVQVAIWCIQEDPSLRPTMRTVTQMLEGVVEVPIPPCPCPYAITG